MFMVKKRMAASRLVSISVDLIDPNPLQPRKIFDEYELNRLSLSIKQNGLLQPVTVRQMPGGRYELVAGERRLRAVRQLGHRQIDAIIITPQAQSAAILSLIENLQRQNLSMFEEAEGILKIMQTFSLSGTEAAAQIGIAPSTLSNKLKILSLTEEQRKRMVAARLSERHARALVRLNEKNRDEILDIIIAEGLTVAETDALVERTLTPREAEKKPHIKGYAMGDIRIISNSIDKMVDSIKKSGVKAHTLRNETAMKIEYRIIIDKPQAKRSDSRQLKMPDLI